jgi:hypothetical protein
VKIYDGSILYSARAERRVGNPVSGGSRREEFNAESILKLTEVGWAALIFPTFSL